MKITFGKSEPYKSGWKGWMDWVEVFIDGKQVGMLYADGEDHRKYMAYHFTDQLRNLDGSPRSGIKASLGIGGVIGLRAAKLKISELLIAEQAHASP